MESDRSFSSRPGTCVFMCLFEFELEMVKLTNQEEVNIYFQCENK